MTQHQSALTTLIGEVLADPDLAHSDVFRRMLQAGLQDLINAEATAKIGAAPHQRTPERTTRRNGTRPKTLATPAGEVDLQIPKLREGSFFPSLLHPRRRVDKALYAVICQAWIDGVSTRKVDQLIRALGNDTGISRSTVSRICVEIDESVQEFLHRRIDHTWFPYLFLDATYLDVRHRGRVVSQALIVATGVSGDGRREILGMALGDAETTDSWTEFLRGLRERGLKVSDSTVVGSGSGSSSAGRVETPVDVRQGGEDIECIRLANGPRDPGCVRGRVAKCADHPSEEVREPGVFTGLRLRFPVVDRHQRPALGRRKARIDQLRTIQGEPGHGAKPVARTFHCLGDGVEGRLSDQFLPAVCEDLVVHATTL